jgi:hypothetical protein
MNCLADNLAYAAAIPSITDTKAEIGAAEKAKSGSRIAIDAADCRTLLLRQ